MSIKVSNIIYTPQPLCKSTQDPTVLAKGLKKTACRKTLTLTDCLSKINNVYTLENQGAIPHKRVLLEICTVLKEINDQPSLKMDLVRNLEKEGILNRTDFLSYKSQLDKEKYLSNLRHWYKLHKIGPVSRDRFLKEVQKVVETINSSVSQRALIYAMDDEKMLNPQDTRDLIKKYSKT